MGVGEGTGVAVGVAVAVGSGVGVTVGWVSGTGEQAARRLIATISTMNNFRIDVVCIGWLFPFWPIGTIVNRPVMINTTKKEKC